MTPSDPHARAKVLLKQLSDAADYDEYNQPYLPESVLPMLLTYADEIRQECLTPHAAAGLLSYLKGECEAQHARAESAESRVQQLREALEAVLPYAEATDDEGPADEGWQSERLVRLINAARAALTAPQTDTGER